MRWESDIDLLYVRVPGSTISLWELWELRDELAHLLGRKVDLVPKDNLHWVIRDHVLAEARNVYAA
ncbi:MAG: nucleotidyltransferase family protein [Pseudonocardiaceae bacterium]